MDVTNGVCTACNRAIDTYAKLCPFCGANPETGEKPDTQQLLAEVFQPRQMSATDNVLEFARHRQGIVITAGIIAVFLLLTGLHQYVTWRNAKEVTDAPPVPLTEVTDLNSKSPERATQLPDLEFQYGGQPKRLQTLIVEPGAVTPPEVIAAQQAAAQAAAPQSGVRPPGAPANGQPPGAVQPAAPRPPVATPPVPPRTGAPYRVPAPAQPR